jgi:hypothetical protein
MGGEGYAWASRPGHWQVFISDMLGGFFLVMFCGMGRRGREGGGGLLNMLTALSNPSTEAMTAAGKDKNRSLRRVRMEGITIRRGGHDRMEIERTGQEGIKG